MKRKGRGLGWGRFLVFGVLALLLPACGGRHGSTGLPAPPSPWTWISGGATVNQTGTYGVQGMPAAANVPGARGFALSWVDGTGNFWLFGGDGRDSTGTGGRLNDLWKFNGTQWAWVSGSSLANQPAVYGVQGAPAAANIPGGRYDAVSWIDAAGALWLFGGSGNDSTGSFGRLNDLWKFTAGQWTWVSGANVINQSGTYGVKGVAAAANIPGAREGSISWLDLAGNLWLFGGAGRDSAGASGSLNDLWKFDGTNWTWISGTDVTDQSGTYGVLGNPAPANLPGGRAYSVSWIDTTGNFWLFGGLGWDSAGGDNLLNDLWKFDGTNWTWVSGANLSTQFGIYGVKGTPAAANAPGSRDGSISWVDAGGSFWLFGGYGAGKVGALGSLNDLWKFDGTQWTWVSGTDSANQSGDYGIPSANAPGGRFGSVPWIDLTGNLWLLGGIGFDSAGTDSPLNDLWRFAP